MAVNTKIYNSKLFIKNLLEYNLKRVCLCLKYLVQS